MAISMANTRNRASDPLSVNADRAKPLTATITAMMLRAGYRPTLSETHPQSTLPPVLARPMILTAVAATAASTQMCIRDSP